jgi:hypothetical protein
MSEDDFQQSKAQGSIRSDGRGAIDPEWEGTNAAIDLASAHHYMPAQGTGRIVKIAVHPEDQDKWFTSTHDDYARTREPIPWDRVVSHTSEFDKRGGTSFRDSVVEREPLVMALRGPSRSASRSSRPRSSPTLSTSRRPDMCVLVHVEQGKVDTVISP